MRAASVALLFVLAALPAQAQYTLEQVKSYPFPNELTAAATGSRIAWAMNEEGRRNVYVAEGPSWTARRLTSYTIDDGQEITSLALSADGRYAVFVRGGDHGSNWDDELPVNPAGAPIPPRVEMISIPFAGGPPISLGEGAMPEISPRGNQVAFIRDRAIWLVPIDGSDKPRRIIGVRGDNGSIQWSPDGSALAFVSSRGDHSFIGVWQGDSAAIRWIAPSTSRDVSPRWSPDGKKLVFVRRPGTGGPPSPALGRRHTPWSIWTADVATGAARRIWKAPETLRGSIPTTHGGTNLHWAASSRSVYLGYEDGWPHLYSIPDTGGTPLLLTPGNYMAEYISMSPDRKFMVFAANAGSTPDDIDRRHIVKVSVDRADARVMTPGDGLEWTPFVTGDGASIAFISAGARRPPLPAVMPVNGGAVRPLASNLIPADFPSSLVIPKKVVFRSSDGVEVHGQLFEPQGRATGRRPAVVYIHGGPPRQMLLGWHYSDYYSNAYALNQYLASRGFVVLAVNYRLGIGYGYEFHQPPNAGSQGASEYLDIRAAGEYLKSLPQVDGSRIGVYGGSYGGYLTALALAKDSKLFAAGVDIHGVHDFTADGGARLGNSQWRFERTDRDSAAVIAWQSSPVAYVSSWTSPVLLIHSDDDRNVRFSQTVDLARRLEIQGVPYEEIVIPDDTHHWMLHRNLMTVNGATAEFLERKLAGKVTQ
jgi:dipeptidyl aminopeptidase/acylaminoacyl peptidase